MVDFSNTTDRCILHIEGDVNDGDYVELTTDEFDEKQAIAIFKFLSQAKADNLYLTDLQEEEFEEDDDYDFEDEDNDDTDDLYDANIENELDRAMFDVFRTVGLSVNEANNLLEEAWSFIPNCEDYLAHTIYDVKLYKFENNEFYWYDNTEWKKVF